MAAEQTKQSGGKDKGMIWVRREDFVPVAPCCNAEAAWKLIPVSEVEGVENSKTEND